jgi:hypothetical protein
MHKSLFAVGGLTLLLLSQPAAAFGGLTEAGELEHARANARAGGPVSERDAELLERWGCTSGTQNEFCERLDDQRRHPHHKHHRHIERD